MSQLAVCTTKNINDMSECFKDIYQCKPAVRKEAIHNLIENELKADQTLLEELCSMCLDLEPNVHNLRFQKSFVTYARSNHKPVESAKEI